LQNVFSFDTASEGNIPPRPVEKHQTTFLGPAQISFYIQHIFESANARQNIFCPSYSSLRGNHQWVTFFLFNEKVLH